jgi:hypothetical protein
MRRHRFSTPVARAESCSLPPLRWVAEQDLIYDPATNTLHRSGCRHVATIAAPRPLPAHAALEIVWAPIICACRPDVTLSLSHTT